MNGNLIYLIVLILTFLLTVAILRKLIPYLKEKKIGQKILEIGPNWHKSKEGTPTMGGLAFVIASIVSITVGALLCDINSKEIALIINVGVFSLLNSMIGLIDDLAKIRHRKNEGLTSIQKYLLQTLVAILFLLSLRYTIGINTVIRLPFFDKSIDLGWGYFVIAYFLICGIVNSVNLTDGIDGLASTVTLVVGIMLSLTSVLVIKSIGLSIFAAVLVGATTAFFIFNHYPAKVFMGDTGSLFLGAIVVGCSFLLDNVLLVLIYGFVYVCEAVSVVLQVIFFKFTKGKRLLKMAPLHHHFEKSGWSENKIVFVFSLVSIVFCFISYLEILL